MKTLNVRKVTKTEVSLKWNAPLPRNWEYSLYIRCNSKGVVNWDKASVYRADELIERNNCVIHKD